MMITRLQTHITRNKAAYAIGFILVISLLIRTWDAVRDTSVWWDGAIYVGMGKYIASGGSIGFWEIFRPPLFPLFYALLITLHLPFIFIAKVFVVFGSVAAIWLSYVLAESIQKGSGIFASIFLSITPVFFSFSKIPITDIISTFFVLLALLQYSKKRHYLTGLFISIAFLLRFPQGLSLVSIAILIISDAHTETFSLWIKNIVIKGILVALGFATLAGPYFISNYLLYGDALKPLILGNAIIGGYMYLYDLGFWYYAKGLLKTAPFLYLSILAPIFIFKKNLILPAQAQKNFRTIAVTAIVFCVYFFWQPHKELRYSIAFIPYLAILAGISAYYLYAAVPKKNIAWIVFCGLIGIFLYQSFPYLIWQKQPNVFAPLNENMRNLKGSYISTTPTPTVFSDIHIVEFVDSTTTMSDALLRRGSNLDGMFINMCDFSCPLDVTDKNACAQSVVHSAEQALFRKTFQTTIYQCSYMIFQK